MAERGSVLLLFPAGVLVMLILGSIAVDFSIAHMAERELAAAAAAAANDAAGAGLDAQRFRSTGEVVLDPAAAERAGLAAISRRAASFHLAEASVVVVDADTVEVTVRARVPYVFARAVPGAPDGAEVQATARADAVTRG